MDERRLRDTLRMVLIRQRPAFSLMSSMILNVEMDQHRLEIQHQKDQMILRHHHGVCVNTAESCQMIFSPYVVAKWVERRRATPTTRVRLPAQVIRFYAPQPSL